ncbi:GDSL-type esterase/lipase family protein [Paraflavisolibacter sp. H34]|uniref:GDSL-type esterase/lipase family protein n=1 Tax=Huijunlia imazamoxiresistens TaxID=3127457 RepID=UPI00301A3A97
MNAFNQLRKTFLTALAALCLSASLQAQETQSTYWTTIQKFRAADSVQAPPKKAILFVGSSSFTRWNNMQEWFPAHTVLNRGFGGSKLPDVKLYFEQTKLPKKLKQVVIYAGDNDLAGGNVAARDILQRFQDIVKLIRKEQPRIPIAFVSIKGCPSRAKLIPLVKEANALVKAYADKEKNIDFIDVFSPTMTPDGRPMPDIYVEDGVHLNTKGYKIWASVIEPHLKK